MPKNKELGKRETQERIIERGPLPVLILVVICTVCVALLAFTADMTAEAIAKQQQDAAGSSKLTLIPETAEIPAEATEEAIEGVPGAVMIDLTAEDFENVRAIERALDKNGEVVGVLISAASKGYHGPLPVTVGISISGQITGLLVDASEETAGLGQEVADPPFTDQFIGRPTDDKFSVDYVSAATISSKAVVKSVRLAAAVFDALMGKGGE